MSDVMNPKLAIRTLLKTPLVTAVAILSLALGIGANTAIFTLFHHLLVRPLAVAAPSQLVNLSAPGPKPGSNSCNDAGDCEVVFSYPMFRDLERDQRSFTGIAAHRLFSANLSIRGQTVSGTGLLISGSYFPVLGLTPALGRLLGPDDDRAVGESSVAVLSYDYWQTRFGLDPGVLNEKLIVNGQAMTIVGISPRGFAGTTVGTRPEVFVPITFGGAMDPFAKSFDNRRVYWTYLFARLKPDVSLERARSELNGTYQSVIRDVELPLQKGMTDQTMARFRAKQLVLSDGSRGQSRLPQQAKTPLILLLGVTTFVLLIACANIANLLLTRAAGRVDEIAVRLSLGASRGQLVAQLLTESSLLALAGGMLSVFVARWTLDVMFALLPADSVRGLDAVVDLPVAFFAAAVTMGTGLMFGLFPAIHCTRPDLICALKGQVGQPSGAKTAKRFRTTLATVQIALSMTLLAAAGLFTKSLANVSRVDLGLSIEHIVTFGLSPSLNGYTPQASRELFERLEDQLAVLPGVTDVSDSLVPLLSGDSWSNGVSVQGFEAGPDFNSDSRYNEVGPGYFRTLGVPILAGRDFSRADAGSLAKVAIINEAFARKFTLGRNPVGKWMGRRNEALDIEIIGLARDAKYSDVKDEVPPVVFRPYRQDDALGTLTFFVRTSADPADFVPTIPRLIAQVDPNLPVQNLRTLPQQVRENVFLDRFISIMSAAFATLATLLAAVGLYGVLAYAVSQRTREIGLRMALGAAPSRIRTMVLADVGIMVAIGGGLGLTAAIAVGHLAESLLYRLRGWDPMVIAAASVTLGLVALAAGSIPAYRASQIDPMRALRHK